MQSREVKCIFTGLFSTVTILMANISKIMKKLFKKFKQVLFISLLFLSLSSTCQQTSTVLEIYNYNVGDIFHVLAWGSSPGGGFDNQYSYEITGKYYSPGNDTLYYPRHVRTAESNSIDPEWVFEDYYDTVFYNNLDSLINHGSIDSVYSDTALFNGRIINEQYLNFEYVFREYQYVEGCGGPYEWFTNIEEYVDYSIELKYFKKGDEEWGEPLMVSTGPILTINNPLKVYPNPFISEFTIELNNINSKNCEGLIFDLNGKQLLQFPLKANQSNAVHLPGLGKGLYLLKIKGNPDYQQLIIKN